MRHSNGKLLIFICLLDFCAGLHILEVGNAIRPISMGFHAKTKPPRSCRSEGVLVLVLTALAHQAVKPLAEIVCNYFCCNGDDRRQRRKEGGAVGAAACRMRVPPKARSRRREPQSELIEFTKHSPSVARMGKGQRHQYNTSSDPIQQKATAYDHTVPAAAFLFFLPSTAFFVDKDPACYYNNVVKMALLCGFAAVQNK